MKINNNKRNKTMPMYEVYASKWDNPNYRAAIDRNIKLNAKKTRKRKFLAIERNNKAIMKITEMLMEWSNQNSSEEIKNKIFVNKFYYGVALDLHNSFEEYGQLTEKQINFIHTFDDKMKTNMEKNAERNAEKMQSKPIGIIGNRQEFNLTILRVKESDLQVSYNNYVTSFKHDLIDADKNLFTMYSSKNYLEENNNNNEINISAIVKAHKIFNSVNYTHIKCPKIIK